MALSAAQVLTIVNSGFAAAGDIIKSGFLERQTGQATFNTATLSMDTPSTSQTACRALFDGANDDTSDGGVVETKSEEVIYLADLAATPPNNSDRLRIGSELYAILEVEDVSAGTGHLFKVTAQSV